MFATNYGDKYRGQTVLVTGGAGAIGANLIRTLDKLGAKVIIIDNLSSGYKTNIPESPRITFYEGDIADPTALKGIFTQGIDTVFHLAAFFANQNSVDNPLEDIRTNVVGTLHLLEHSRDHNVKHFVYINTPCMYNSEGDDWTENSKDIRHDTPYSISKFTGEQYSKFFYKHYGLPVTSVRIFNSFGPHEHPGKYRNVIPNFMRAALNGESLTITGTGEETRSFTFVEDTVKGLLLAGVSYDGTWQIYNIGSTRETKIIDLANKINAITGNKAPVTYVPRRSWDKSLRRRPDISKAGQRLGYKPVVDLDEGLDHTFNWFKSITK